jgi:acyl-CoA synthetase (NDP forming)
MSSSPSSGRATSLRVFADPGSVAVVGASADPAKWGYWLARGALQGSHRRAVHLVSVRGGRVHDQQCAADLAALGEVPELVALCVPAGRLPAVVDQALELGVRGLLAITSGVADQAALAGRVRAAGARMIGPNSLGLVDTATDLHLAWGSFTSGPLAVVSQSGQLGTEIARLAARPGSASPGSCRSATRSTCGRPSCSRSWWSTRRPGWWPSTWRASPAAGSSSTCCAACGLRASTPCC